MKKLAATLGLALVVACRLGAQATDTTLQAVPLRETVISANRFNENREAVAQQVVVLDQKLIAQMNAQTTADLLIQSGAVFVQKSQQGGGSPVLRGFEASRVLLVVDGIRMNNAIYRAGHLQNVITLDNASFDRAEILFGPASTVYGSDALGGAMCFYTKNPLLAGEGEGFRNTGAAFARYGTVNEEKTGHVDISLAGERFGSLTSFTYSDFGDLKMGAKEGPDGAFGERPYYVERINGVDSLVKNSDPLVQR
ncbi:MAG TPA: TonB-dependent receptor plug domain-containing protein, partial [Saprospiraceae bacterium]|nr:TonB-dependent receptor plug domain-containing protein [Saprospiraceae bacterium]